MTYLTFIPEVSNCMNVLCTKETLLGELMLNCLAKFTSPKSFANQIGKPP